jgi:hypothetical protein
MVTVKAETRSLFSVQCSVFSVHSTSTGFARIGHANVASGSRGVSRFE